MTNAPKPRTLVFRSGGPQHPTDLVVDFPRLVSGRMLVQTNSGGGKSRAIRYLAEQTHSQVQQIIIDPEGEFGSLREKFDYVLVGEGGDLAADVRHAKHLCRRLLELNASAILDLYALTIDQRKEYVRVFLTELMHLPRDLWRPLLVMIDEAHKFCPEGATSESAESVITLCSQGRKRGFAAVLATQRLSKLNKDAAAELLNVMIGRTGLDVDVKRAGDTLGLDKEGRAELAKLEPGTFYAYGPAIASAKVLVRTGNVVTRHPEPGEVRTEKAPPAKEAVRAILEHMADLPQAVEQEADELKALREQVATLSRELGQAKRATAKPDASIDAARLAQVQESVAASWKAIADARVTGVFAWAADVLTEANNLIHQVEDSLKSVRSRVLSAHEQARDHDIAPTYFRNVPAVPHHTKQLSTEREHMGSPSAGYPYRDVSPATPKPAANGGEPSELKDLTNQQRRMIETLAEFRAMDVDALDFNTLAAYSQISPKSSQFKTNLKVLSDAGLIVRGFGTAELTPAGAGLVQVDAPATIVTLHERWLKLLSESQARMLRLLLHNHPRNVIEQDLADAAGRTTTSSMFGDDLRALKRFGLIAKHGDTWGLTNQLFPGGHR